MSAHFLDSNPRIGCLIVIVFRILHQKLATLTA
jgi:hypothetical protein